MRIKKESWKWLEMNRNKEKLMKVKDKWENKRNCKTKYKMNRNKEK